MPLTRQQKKDLIDGLVEQLKSSHGTVLASYRGLTMPDFDALREELRKSGVQFHVVKNTLLAIGLEQAGVDGAKEFASKEPLAIAFSPDEVSAAKAIKQFAAQHEQLAFVAGVMEGKLLSKEQVAQLASLPTKEELLSSMVGSLAAPMTGFVRVLNGTLTSLLYALKAIEQKKA